MSVPVNQRSQGKLEAYTRAYELASYTLKITQNKKAFTVEYQETLTSYLISAALDIYMFTGDANDIQVRTREDLDGFKARVMLQKKAIQRCKDMNKLILLAKPIFHLSSKRVKYWVGMVRETRNLITAWSDSDRRRFLPLFEDKQGM